MPEWLLAILIGSVVLGLMGLLWQAQERRIEVLEKWKIDKEKFDYEFRHEQYAPAIAAINLKLLPLVERADRLDQDCKGLRHFNEEILPGKLDQLASDAFGTISKVETALEKKIERIDKKVFNGKHE